MLLGEGGEPGSASDVFIVTTAPALLSEAFRWKAGLVAAGVRTDMDYEGRSLKSQFRRADRSGASVVLVLGEEEARRGAVGYRDMANGSQEEIPAEEALRRLRGSKTKEG
jgi:histidyl-tRNA synthetase